MVDGVKALTAELTKTIPTNVRNAAKSAMEQGAEELVKMMKTLAPVDSGDLRESIGWTWGKAPKGSRVIARSDPNAMAGLAITVFAGNSKAFYAAWMEFGTAAHINGGMFAGTQNPGVRKHPFFFPAWRSLRKRIRSRITRSISKSIKAG